MLSGIHFLLTYACTFECDHCFLYCSPWSQGTFSLEQIQKTLDQASRIKTVDNVFFEGGEPLLYYPLLLEAVRTAHQAGFKVGIVTNAYLSHTPLDAELWLKPLARAGLDFLSISDDSFHYGDREITPARIAREKAHELGISVDSIAISDPTPEAGDKGGDQKGAPVEGGQAMFRGRAADKLTSGLAGTDPRKLTKCPYEDLADPSRVHVDAYGNVHLCQGLLMGNMWKTPLPRLVEQYEVGNHPLCSALDQGGPALLAERLDVDSEPEYVDECHFCFSIRRSLLDRYPEYLAPRQVYGLESQG